MTEDSKTEAPFPSVVAWSIICFVVGTGILWLNAGTRFTLWWLGLIVGFYAVSWALKWLYDFLLARKMENLASITEGFGRLSIFLSGLVLLFGAIAVVVIVTKPLFRPSYSDEPQNYRR